MKYAIWLGMTIVSFVMLAGGVSKLLGVEAALESFAALGLPGWFVFFIAIAEIAGAIGIWIKRTSMWAAIGLSVIMVGAIYYHVAFPPISAALPATVVLAICSLIGYRRGTGVVG